MIKKVGLLTGGGDSSSLNAVIRAVVRRAVLGFGWSVLGIRYGFRGLIEATTQPLGLEDTDSLLTRGGTILGASNRSNPFHYPVGTAGGVRAEDVSGRLIATVRALELEGLVVVGGDGTLAIAAELAKRGVPIVGVPKTIDNDLPLTDTSCGYPTAVAIVAEALDRLRTTAESHDRVMLCEVMGRYAGWIALEAGIAGGADLILIPEIPYDLERVARVIEARQRSGQTAALVVVAEGAHAVQQDLAVDQPGDATRLERLGGAAARLASDLGQRLPEIETRVTVLGHVQRGGTPCAADRVLATGLGVAAVDLIAARRFGTVALLRGGEITAVPLAELSAGTKLVDPNGQLANTARGVGIELGQP